MNTEILKLQKEYFYNNFTKDIDFRLEKLNLLKDLIKKYEKELIEALYKDLGKSEFESYMTEIGLLYEELDYFVKNLKSLTKLKKVKTSKVHYPAESYIMYEPKGVVFILSPWNYPVQLLLMPLIGAIASGNCAVLKPSEKAQNVANVLENMINNHFKNEYLYVVRGKREISNELLKKPFDHIFFTGSMSVGKMVMRLASDNLVPVTLELGGKSPVIVDETANLEIAAKRIVWGKILNAGQTCVAPDYLYVHKNIKVRLLEEISVFIKKIFKENYLINEEYPKIINEHHFKRLISLLNEGKIVLGGNYDDNNLKIEFTIIEDIDWTNKLMADEIFGPILPVLIYDNINEVIDTIKRKGTPLALYIFTESEKTANLVTNSIQFGGGCINDTVSHVSNNNLPFGGAGSSGMGKYHGKSSFYTFSNEKIILKKSTRFDAFLKYPPFTKKKLSILRKLLK